jgi:hypothetical protein
MKKDYIKINLRDIECGGVDYINLTQDRDIWRTLGNEPSGSIGCCEILEELQTGNFSRRITFFFKNLGGRCFVNA